MDLAQRKLSDLQGYIAFLEENNQLIRVKTEVDPHL
ncbi:MAG: 3-polyprenyl-4-hydroxybenzoate decarboxylase, partial [Cryomorphaceae bacterium]